MSKKKTTSQTTLAKHRLLVVDDHALVRHGLRAMISAEADLEVCGEATSASEALEKVRTLEPDLIIIDLTLQEGHGLDLIKQIKARNADTKMLVLSMHDESLYAERVLRAGAMGYINKSEATDKIIVAIRHVLSGKVYLNAAMTERLLQSSLQPRHVSGRLPNECLSDRELMVFELIGEGFSTREIAEKLYLSIKTIETYREHIKTKLNLKNSSELSRDAAQWVLQQRDKVAPSKGE